MMRPSNRTITQAFQVGGTLAIAASSLVALERIQTISLSGVPLWRWMLPEPSGLLELWSGTWLLIPALAGLGWAAAKRSAERASLVCAVVTALAYVHLILAVTRLPSPNAWIDLRGIQLIATTSAVFDTAVLALAVQVVFLSMRVQNSSSP